MTAWLKAKPAVILLAEDDPGDQELTRRALQECKIKNELHLVQDGEEALDYLFRRGRYKDPASSPRPNLFLLDLNMPKIDGRQVLEQIKSHPMFHHMVIVVLTTSEHEEDIVSSYDLGVNSYVTKPVDFNTFVRIVQTIGNYWFQVVVLPPHEE